MLTINGWAVLAHPLFLDQWEKLIEAVNALKTKKPEDYQKSADAKLLAAMVQLVTVTVPSDPAAAIYRQGSTLRDDRKHWFRAKFGNGRFRLFFRYSSASKVIIFAWVNDENTLRTYKAKTDAYSHTKERSRRIPSAFKQPTQRSERSYSPWKPAEGHCAELSQSGWN